MRTRKTACVMRCHPHPRVGWIRMISTAMGKSLVPTVSRRSAWRTAGRQGSHSTAHWPMNSPARQGSTVRVHGCPSPRAVRGVCTARWHQASGYPGADWFLGVAVVYLCHRPLPRARKRASFSLHVLTMQLFVRRGQERAPVVAGLGVKQPGGAASLATANRAPSLPPPLPRRASSSGRQPAVGPDPAR